MLSITETHIHFLVIVAFNIFLIPPCWTKLCIGGVNIFLFIDRSIQKQPRRSVLRKRCSKVMQQIYRRAPMPKRSFNEVASNFMPKRSFNEVASNFIEIALRHGCSPINLLHNFRTPLSKTTHLWTATSVFMNSKNLLCLRSSLCRVLIVPKRSWSLPDLLIVRKCIIN